MIRRTCPGGAHACVMWCDDDDVNGIACVKDVRSGFFSLAQNEPALWKSLHCWFFWKVFVLQPAQGWQWQRRFLSAWQCTPMGFLSCPACCSLWSARIAFSGANTFANTWGWYSNRVKVCGHVMSVCQPMASFCRLPAAHVVRLCFALPSASLSQQLCIVPSTSQWLTKGVGVRQCKHTPEGGVCTISSGSQPHSNAPPKKARSHGGRPREYGMSVHGCGGIPGVSSVSASVALAQSERLTTPSNWNPYMGFLFASQVRQRRKILVLQQFTAGNDPWSMINDPLGKSVCIWGKLGGA